MGRKIITFIVDIAQTVILAFCIFLVTYIFLFRPFQVSGASMDPTFKDKEYILTNLIVLRFDTLKVGDVVVFVAPNQENTEFKKDYIKRILGVPGDIVSIQDGHIFRNGQQLDESKYLASDVMTYGGAFMREDVPVTVPEDSYIAIGDNRPYSSDSREWGFVKKSEIIGKSFFVYWPTDKIQYIKNPFE